MPIPARNVVDRRYAAREMNGLAQQPAPSPSVASGLGARGGRTHRIGASLDVDKVVHDPNRQVPDAQRIERPIVEIGHVADDHGRGKKPNVLKVVHLRSLGADNGRLGGCVPGGGVSESELPSLRVTRSALSTTTMQEPADHRPPVAGSLAHSPLSRRWSASTSRVYVRGFRLSNLPKPAA
ncbi:hypothetical protein AAL_06867 [Moelleriella libera RCEF 2490]|uniref:Uncharacterized protein n=1 Tax=Moelleriella libera RCEF 2490 TaxID=1081109 RepID=A0A167YBW9_9HYPO|nr:hypothetical protein AAL_06867 [Moelleriella libera RCEF 2490]